MTATITITRNWQLHVPRAMRALVGLTKPGRVTISVKYGALVIRPQKSRILGLGGSLQRAYKKKPIDIESVRDAIDYGKA